ncbi:uncharacterized protein LOC124873471 isoform X2 [Girardinichthys multiradiatus]|uniref:uncharacterized protein LOC124873471 isoform X2 n=1 Tax=Girardinichthys multiradiatus TaxID=208333 RepID=UPI001FAD7592|nr:uncharacterized protein LOC124873471 isoform X2 [Girardinichthys multiradiatus]
MKMSLKSAIVALLTVAGATLVMPSVHHVDLDDTVKKINVSLGSSINFHCCLKINASVRCRVEYFFQGFNQTDSNPEKVNCNATNPANCNLTTGCQSTYKLLNISRRNYGFYFCKVILEIPSLIEMLSNKTEVALINTDEVHDDWWMWVFVGVPCLVFILIVLLVICVVQSRPCNRGAGEEPIYVNTRLNKPSPRLMPADNLKTVPSSQDLQTPSSVRRYDERHQRYK